MAVPVNPFICWDNRFADAEPVASSTYAGAAANIANFRPYTNWTPVTLPATITVDCGTPKYADCLGLFNHTLASSGSTIQVRGSTDNFVASDVLVATLVPDNNTASIVNFTSVAYRYWRITITGTVVPTLSIVALGVGLEFPTGLPYGFDPLARQVFGQTNISEQGLPLGKVILFEQWKQNVSFNFIPSSWLRTVFLPTWKIHLRGKPFLFAWDLTRYPTEIYLVEAGDSIKSPQNLPAYSTLSFDIKGVALP